MQNFRELDMKKKMDPKAVTFWVSGLKTSLGQFGLKRHIKQKYGTLAPIFTNWNSFSPE